MDNYDNLNQVVCIERKKKYLGLIIPFVIVFALLVAAGAYYYISYKEEYELLTSIDTEKHEAVIEQSEIWENDINQSGKSILELNEEESVENFYIAPNGLKIKSSASEWNNNDLKIVYNELLNNIHGNEIDYLKEVMLRPEDSPRGDSAGVYSQDSLTLTVAIMFNTLIDDSYLNFASADYGYIEIYHMNDFTEIKEFAGTLTHEYGHHFAFSYFFKGENEDREKSDYFEIRGLGDYPEAKEYQNYDEYFRMHAWDIDEIAAEDYVQLLGSPTGREIGEYMDIKEALFTSDMEYVGDIQRYHYNLFAQENPVIPLAEQVEGLEEYYNSFINDAFVEEYTSYTPIVIEAERKRANGKTHFILTWNELESDSEVVYTVVCYESDGGLYGPIKTVSGEEELSAVIGVPTRKKGNWLYWWDDGIMDDDRIIRVLAYVVDKDIVIGSEPYYFDS